MIDTEDLGGMHAPFSFYIIFIFVIQVKQKTVICKVTTFIQSKEWLVLIL